MGIKRFEKRFNIRHIVQQKNGYIAIGSPYVSDLLMLMQPSLELKWGSLGPSKNDNLARYHEEIYTAWKTGELDSIINDPDEFGETIPVWTYSSGKVTRKDCEEFGWPHTTNDGELMYENTFFKSRKEALKECRQSSISYFKSFDTFWYNFIREIKLFTKHTKRSIIYFIRAFIFFGY